MCRWSAELEKELNFHMKTKSLFLIFLLPFTFSQCSPPSVNLANGIERDIVLVNIEEDDRAFIAQLLLKIDSLKPAVIAVNAMFHKKKEPIQDSLLMVTGMGVTNFEYHNDLVTNFTPLIEIDCHIYESFPLTVMKHWKPGFKHDIKANKSLKISYTRSTEQFAILNGSDINEIDSSVIKDKIILLGYIGPKDEDKFFTPLRFVKKYPQDKPDTYGLVIIANEVKTILEHGIENK
jgi:CHASE2 domain